MKKISSLTIIIFLVKLSLFGQLQNEKFIERDTNIYNRIDTISENIWVTKYDFWNRIDSVFYFPEKKLGLIKAFNKQGQFLWVETYENESLDGAIIGSHSTYKRDSTNSIIYPIAEYFGKRIDFHLEFMTKRVDYYNSGKVKNISKYNYSYIDQYVISFNTDDHSENIDTIQIWTNARHEDWLSYSEEGKLVKKEIYKEDKLLKEENYK